MPLTPANPIQEINNIQNCDFRKKLNERQVIDIKKRYPTLSCFSYRRFVYTDLTYFVNKI